ncbi:hypothetical protein FRC11_009879 [Ceratobasidium sp. 423]|nr:hypothetical protein FRC11_009879 [Ceratobasidium sp. 423]
MAFKRVEDRPSPKGIYNRRLYLLVLIAGWGGALFGYDAAVVGGLVDLPVFRTQFGLDNMTPKQIEFIGSNIESTYQAGCFFGSLVAFIIVERLGRRFALQWASGWFCAGAALMLGARSSIGLLYAGCVLSGFGVGSISLASPLYMAEISPPKVRGQLVGFYEILSQVGECAGFWVNFGVSKHISISAKQWHIPIAVQFIPGGVLFISSMFLQETPRWLYKVGKREEAVTTLAWIRNLPLDDVYIQEEFALIGVQLDRELQVQRKKGFVGQLREISKPGLRNRLALGAGAISDFAPTIFGSIGMARVNSALFATGIYGLVKMVATFIALFWIVDRAGRRLLEWDILDYMRRDISTECTSTMPSHHHCNALDILIRDGKGDPIHARQYWLRILLVLWNVYDGYDPPAKGVSLEHVDKLFGYVAIVVLDVGLEEEVLGKPSLEKNDLEKALH